MSLIFTRRMAITFVTGITIAGVSLIPVSAIAERTTQSTEAHTPTTTANTTTEVNSTHTAKTPTSKDAAQIQAHIQRIITRGDAEIERRIKSLVNVDSKIDSAKKLTDAQKADLKSIVSTNLASMISLKAKLDADSKLSDPSAALTAVQADAKSIILDYRIYALILPQINLIRAADDQQANEAKLLTLAGKLETKLAALKAQGTDTSASEATLADMQSKIAEASGISSTIETDIVALTPQNFNDNHEVLGQFRDKLKTAHNDIKDAVTDAKTIVTSLKS